MKKPKGNFLSNTRCPETGCDGAGDNLVVYDNGTAHCFACGYDDQEYTMTDSVVAKKEITNKPLIPVTDNYILKSRGISGYVCKAYNYCWAELDGHKVQCSSYYENDRIVAQKIRGKDKFFTWLGDSSKATQLFGQHLWETTQNLYVIVTEGEIDAMTYAEITDMKYPVVSIKYGAAGCIKEIINNIEWLGKFRKVLLAFDGDKAGREASLKVAEHFPADKVAIIPMPDGEDFNSLHLAGKDDIIKRLIFKAQEVEYDGLIDASKIDIDYLMKPLDKGIIVPYSKLNESLMGLRKQRLYTIFGETGKGKTTFAKEITYSLLCSNHKLGLIYLEDGLNEIVWSYIAIHNNVPLDYFRIDPGFIGKEKFKQDYETLFNEDRVMIYDHEGMGNNPDKIFSKLETLAFACKVDFIVLDNLSLLISGSRSSKEGERKDIDILENKLRGLIQRSGVGILQLHQPLKINNDNERRDEEGWLSYSNNDIRGSGSVANTSDVVIAIETSDKHKNVSRIHVLKNRVTSKVGICDYLKYEPKTGRLVEA